MPHFEIIYADPDSYDDKGDYEILTVVGDYKDTVDISAEKWAHDHAYSLADKGWYKITPMPHLDTRIGLEKDTMITNFPTVMNPDDLTTTLANSQVQETNALAGFSFLKIDFETGEWLLGQDQEDVTGEELLINTTEIKHGWILWSGGRPTKRMVPFNQPIPQPMEPIGEDHPSEGRALQAAMIDDGEMIAFDTNSYGGRKGVDKLLTEIKTHAASGSKFLYPRVKLASESYANKKRGGKLVYNPVFEVLAWCDQEGNEEDKAPTQVEDKSNTKSDEAEQPAPTEETATEAPKTRQRRKRKKAA